MTCTKFYQRGFEIVSRARPSLREGLARETSLKAIAILSLSGYRPGVYIIMFLVSTVW